MAWGNSEAGGLGQCAGAPASTPQHAGVGRQGGQRVAGPPISVPGVGGHGVLGVHVRCCVGPGAVVAQEAALLLRPEAALIRMDPSLHLLSGTPLG